jgi:hypothetical protein
MCQKTPLLCFSLSLVDIKQNNPDAPSFTLHPHNPALAVSVASELSIQMGTKIVNVKKLEPKPVWQREEKERGWGRKGRTRIRDRYRFWRTIAKVFADGRHTECEHGADCTHHDGVEEHRGLVRLTLLCLCCKVETIAAQ